MAITTIFNVFARSPIKPLQEHMTKAYNCASLLVEFFKAAKAGEWKQAKAIQQTIDKTEDEADALKRELRLHLPKSLFLPVPREAILELLTVQDEVANKAEDISGLIIGRQMEIPKAMAQKMEHYLHRAVEAVKQATIAIDELSELFETGFSENEVLIIEKMIYQLDTIEHDTDQMQVQLRAELFKIEDKLPPVHVMFLYKIIDGIGELADIAQQVGKRLLLLLARS